MTSLRAFCTVRAQLRFLPSVSESSLRDSCEFLPCCLGFRRMIPGMTVSWQHLYGASPLLHSVLTVKQRLKPAQWPQFHRKSRCFSVEMKGKLRLFGTLRAAVRKTSIVYEWVNSSRRFTTYFLVLTFMFVFVCAKHTRSPLFIRLQKLKEAFHGKYGQMPLFYVRAPGRVNLIGGLQAVCKHNEYHQHCILCFIINLIISRWAYWLLWLCCPSNGNRAEYSCCSFCQWLPNNTADQHWPQIQVSNNVLYLLFYFVNKLLLIH